MKILMMGHYPYYADHRQLSYEYVHFFGAIKDIADEAYYFDTMFHKSIDHRYESGEDLTIGSDVYFQYLRWLNPDYIFISFTDNEFTTETLEKMRNICPVIGIFSDDHWRFDHYSKFIAPHLDLCVMNDKNTIKKYAEIGIKPYLWQWGYNRNVYKKLEDNRIKDIDVLFIGQVYADRQKYIDAISQHCRMRGFNFVYYGNSSPNGTLNAEQSNKMINRAKVTMGFSRSSVGETAQMKVRVFEIIAAGSFCLTEDSPDLADYFKIDEEIGMFELGSVVDCIQKVDKWVADDTRREQVALNGWFRGIEYSYQKKFKDIIDYVKANPRTN